jgi:flavonoid 3'-monooxygenase
MHFIFMQFVMIALHQNLLVAGTDPTSITVEWSLSELIRHPEILKRAQEEADAVAGRGRLVSERDLPRLPLLNAVVKETFRLHPSTPLSLPRVAADDCEVAGFHVPKGSELLVNVWGIARDPALWPDPLQFRPSRFLPGPGGYGFSETEHYGYGFIPFGAGRRVCAGRSWGTRMVALACATLAHAFDWELPAGQTPGDLDMEEALTLLLQRAVPLMLRPVPRLLPSAYDIIA